MKIRGIYAILNVTTSEDSSLLRQDFDEPFGSELRAELLSRIAQDYLEGGIRILQLRDKEVQKRRHLFLKTAEKIMDLKKHFDFAFIVNDEVTVAREIGADGVHVGREDSSLETCRDLLGTHRWIGYSSHSIEEAVEAERRGADYVAFGAIFPTSSKGPGHPVQGIERLKQIVEAVRIPVVAIGGIGRENIQEVLATGVASVAMISALANAKDRVAEARYFRECFK